MKPAPLSRTISLGLVILATAFWSTSGIFITLIIQGGGVSPLSLAFWRDLGTFACLLAGIRLLAPHLLRVRRRDLPWLAAMGAFSIGLFHVTWNTTIIRNGVAVSNVFQANAPIFVTVIAWMLWKEPLTFRKIAAIALAFAGTILISQLQHIGQARVDALGILIGLAAAAAYGSLSLFGKKLSGDYNPWTILVYAFGFGSLFLLPFQIGVGVPWPLPLQVLGYYAGLVLITTISGFALYTIGLRGLQASVAAITATSELPMATVLSYVILDERLDLSQILGALLVIGGVMMVSLPRRQARKAPDPRPGGQPIQEEST